MQNAEMPPFQAAINNHNWEAFPLLQGAGDLDYYTKLVVDNLDLVARVNAFLRLFEADNGTEKDNQFMRGVVIGTAVMLMAQKRPFLMPDLMDDVLTMVSMLSARNVNIMNGGKLVEK